MNILNRIYEYIQYIEYEYMNIFSILNMNI